MQSQRPTPLPAQSIVAFVLLLFCATLVPAAVSPPIEPREDLYQLAQSSLKDEAAGVQPQKEQVERRYRAWITHEWFMWWRNLVLLGVSIVAAALVLARNRWGPWLVIAACGYVLVISAPPLVRMSVDGGFFNLSSILLSSGIRYHGTFDGLLLFWHVIIAPFAYGLVAIAAAVLLLRGYTRGGKHESNP